MNKNEETKLKNLKDLTITEQLLFAFDVLIDLKDPAIIESKMNHALLGSTLADLFNLRKAGLVNNKVVITDTEETNFKYINDLIDTLESLDDKKLIIDTIFAYQYKGNGIKNEIQDNLIKNGLLIEKRNYLPLIGPKEIHVSENAFIPLIKERIARALDYDSDPMKEFIYVLAILDAIELLPYFIDETFELDKKRKRLHELMEEEYLAKLIHEAIKSQPDPESLTMYEEPPLYPMGGIL